MHKQVSSRKSKVYRVIAVYLLLNLVTELVFPIAAHALTSGPSQPEVQSFEPVGTSDMVDLFTGDFNYNIPLFELPGPNGGYPFNIAYHSGIGMDQEASWVGLGWNLNPGAIVRNMRGLPDDFNGQKISRRQDIKDNHTMGLGYIWNSELAGADLEKLPIQFSSMLAIYYNNFKGVGYSLSPGFSLNHRSWDSKFNFNLSIDSQEGVGVSTQISHSNELKEKDLNYGVGVSFSSRSGINISTHGGLSVTGEGVTKASSPYTYSTGGGNSFSFASNAYTPLTSNSTVSVDLGISFKSGLPSLPMLFPNNTLRGFYSIDHNSDKNTETEYSGFGYNYLATPETFLHANGLNPHHLYDYNREKENTIFSTTPNLAAPSLTFDYYNVQGQGIGGSYRAYSPQAGRCYDPEVMSFGVGATVGIEASPIHYGVDIELAYNSSHTTAWDEDNEWSDYYKFREFSQWNDNFADGSVAPEPIYYKSLGEMTSFETDAMDYIGGESAVRAKLDKQGTFVSRKYVPQDGELITSDGADLTTGIAANRNYRERTARTNVIYPISNNDLCNNGTPVLPEYLVNYHSAVPTSPAYYPIAPTNTLSRTTRNSTDISSHNAGVTALNPDGNRYVYALPVYNLNHHEIAFSAPAAAIINGLPSTAVTTPITDNIEPDYDGNGMGDTEQYFSETDLGAYAHSYLLTSILGVDYIDVTGDGVTEDDLGYWVKFNYVKAFGDNNSEARNPYKWRAPYQNALYEPGLFSTAKDDKGYIEYGEKEIYYLATAETKTHIASFSISPRNDGMDAFAKYSGNSRGSSSVFKLDAIELFSRTDYEKISDTNLGNDADVRPIKKIAFEYNYSLCDNTANTTTGLTGKLTLKKIFFEYQNNARSTLSPYEFEYAESNHSLNPDYSIENYDRWANYKSESDGFNRKYLPYVTQFDRSVTQNQSNINTFQTIKNQEQSAWHLREIKLPTGGKITVDYEADDYAYVQHRRATQMFNVSHFYDSSNPNSLYLKTDWNNTDPTKRRVFFKLEKPIPADQYAVENFFEQYISGLKESDGTYQMYYKLLMKVRQESENHLEFISGYCNLLVDEGGLHDQSTPVAHYGLTNSTVTIDNVQCYTEGFVTLDLTRVQDTDTDEYHPFAVASWQHLRTTQPDLLHTFGTTTYSNSNTPSVMDKVNAARSLLSFLTDFEQMFKGFRKYCFEQDYGRYAADLDYCVIRLCSPDKKKFGGGSRVSKLTINDDWNNQSGESSSTYGQTYDYTATDNSGATISSGVASYEPQIGGDEIALRHAKHFPQEIPIFTDNDLFFEYPVNESNYPAPIVGYSKVTVKSITTEDILNSTLPAAVRGTGAVVTEFYTSRDYPVITDETPIETKPFKLYIPIPFIGDIRTNNLTASQGYAITLNDMHGKLKAVTNYGLNAQGALLDKPESKVEYVYKSKTIVTPEGIEARALVNEVKLIHDDAVTSNGKYETEISDGIMGVDYDFFTDQRKNRNFSVSAGLDFNVESFFPFPWPSFSCFTNDVRTAVTNKIIHKTGILEKVIATDAQSEVVTENKVFDALTGRPLLVTVQNNFNDPVYRYDIPAHWEYDNMGAAYKNIGYAFIAKVKSINTTWHNFQIEEGDALNPIKLGVSGVELSFDDVYNTLAEGDEFILHYDTDDDGTFESTEPKGRATLIERREECASPSPVKTLLFHSPINVSQGIKVYMQVVRSGRRNLLNVNAGSIVSLSNPTDNANRGYENLNNVGITNAALAPEIAEFLNYTIDCNGQLMFKTYDLTASTYYSSEGDHLFPLLSTVFSSITVEECEGGFRLIFSVYTPSGTCTQIDCGCFSLTQKGESHLDITNFTASGTTITVKYEDNTTTQFTINCFEDSIRPVLTFIDSVLNASAITFRDYWDYDGTIGSCQSSSAAANLYAIGKKGIWRPWKDYYYSDERYKNTSHTSGTQLAGDGVFDGDGTNKRYYLYRWNATIKTPVPTQWKPNNTITRFDKDGNELENKNIIGNYSCAKFGYDNTLAVAIAANARYFEVYYQSAEDQDNLVNLPGGGTNGVSSARSHTGLNSILINDGQNNRTMELSNNLFQEGKEYVISMWVARATPQYTYKESSSANSAAFSITSTTMGGTTISTSTVFEPTGEVIEGWQRIEARFTTPNNSTAGEEYVKLKIVFQGGSVGGNYVNTWFDDIRVFPSNGNMVSYVYDPVTFRLKAKLDDNNFATFYHYDEEGNLFLVKQETSKGVATIQEARSHKQH